MLREVGKTVGYRPAGGARGAGNESTGSDRTHDDEDSWINIDDVDDRRGRVGEQWPWQRG
jgi:hypothetical protein